MGLKLMKKRLPLYFFVALIAACNASEKDVPALEISVKTDIPAKIIDNTPVTALALGGSIRALKTDADLGNPENAVWREAQEYSMQLGMAPPVHPSINLRYDATAASVPVFLRAATDGNNLYLRMRWADDSENTATSREDFADGAAVQFALGDVATTSFMMGAANGPVNIWYWKAGQPQAQNLAAGGFGSTTLLDKQVVTANAAYGTAEATETNEWTVVLSRSLSEGGEFLADLTPGAVQPLAFAVWDGANSQRDGDKRASTGWIKVDLAPLGDG